MCKTKEGRLSRIELKTFGTTFWDSKPPPTLGQFIEGLLSVKYEGEFLNYTKKVSGIWQYHVYAQ